MAARGMRGRMSGRPSSRLGTASAKDEDEVEEFKSADDMRVSASARRTTSADLAELTENRPCCIYDATGIWAVARTFVTCLCTMPGEKVPRLFLREYVKHSQLGGAGHVPRGRPQQAPRVLQRGEGVGGLRNRSAEAQVSLDDVQANAAMTQNDDNHQCYHPGWTASST